MPARQRGAEAGTPARERLDAVAATGDGFVLARLDIELRREGDEVLGASQSGARPSLRLLPVVHDGDVIAEAREDAREIVSADPTLAGHSGAFRGGARHRAVQTRRTI
ncbi:MAG: hypothetical protein WKF83_11615 [Nocardioidaceae bacterium]